MDLYIVPNLMKYKYNCVTTLAHPNDNWDISVCSSISSMLFVDEYCSFLFSKVVCLHGCHSNETSRIASVFYSSAVKREPRPK